MHRLRRFHRPSSGDRATQGALRMLEARGFKTCGPTHGVDTGLFGTREPGSSERLGPLQRPISPVCRAGFVRKEH